MSIARIMQQAAAGGSDSGAWDLSFAYYDPPESLTWVLSAAVDSENSFSVLAEESAPTGLFFKPDGTKMYVCGTAGDDVNEYDLSIAWDVSTAVYLQNFSVAAEEITPEDLFFKPDGTKMYVLGSTGDDVNEYDLSTAWDVSTAVYLQNFSVAAQENSPQGIFFKPDGTKMYVIGTTGDDVNEYDLSTAWDVSTAVYLQNFSVNAQEDAPRGLSFKTDGTKMYVVGNVGDDVNEYDLSTPWDVSSASYIRNFSVATEDSTPFGIFFNPDGSGFYIVGGGNRTIYQYTLGGFSVAAQEASPDGLFFKPDGTKMYITGNVGDDVNEYDLSTAWDISTASYLQNFSISAQETAPRGLFFKPDGTKMYVVGIQVDEINEYDLSTPWDISTASFLQLFSVAAEDTGPEEVFFKPDGTKMYVAGNAGNDINEYDLSTPWDISTASFLQSFSLAAQSITQPRGLFFKPNGTKMYVADFFTGILSEYDLSTAWDISTASYLQNFSVNSQGPNPASIFFRDDGTQMFIVEPGTDRVFSYTLGPQ